jgi:CBS domain-containing protein
MEEITAAEVMIPLDNYPHVPYWFTLRQAIAEIENTELDIEGRKSMPRVVLVFDEEYRLIGLVRRRDILRGLGPDALQDPLEREGERDPGFTRDLRLARQSARIDMAEIKKRAERKVQEIMTPVRVSVGQDAPLMEVVSVMVMNDISLVPVLRDNAVVGVARTAEVLKRIGGLIIE